MLRYLMLVLTLAVMFLPRSAAADLIPVDLFAPNDAKISRDTNTSLDWLDWPETSGLSVTQILGGSGGWLPLGFRYATTSEVCALVTTYGFPMGCPGSANGGWSGLSLTNLGFFPLADGRIETGALFDDGNLADGNAGRAELTYNPATNASSQLVQENAAATDIPGAGHALVRPVPEPSASLLLATAVLLMTVRRRMVTGFSSSTGTRS